MPETLLLQQFGEHIRRAFGHVPFHVGSSLKDKAGWRDVDVRLMLPDEEYARMGFGDPANPQENQRWVSMVLAWSTFGRQLTGLPIDFQIQQRSHANAKHQGSRSALYSICDACARSKSTVADAIYPVEQYGVGVEIEVDRIEQLPGEELRPYLGMDPEREAGR